MFSLGCEFTLRKLSKVGAAALIAAVAEIIFMIFIGYEVGQFFGWKSLDSLFLGAMLAISSTTIIIKALNELGMKKESFAQLTFGILIIEDILAIAMLALLSSISVSGSVNTMDIFTTLGKLMVFIVVSLVMGIFIVPKLLAYVARYKSKEMLLITVLGLCFGFCFLVMQLDYSIALGAFIIGVIIAESKEIELIKRLVKPITDMFSAIFFVSIGLLVDPKIIMTYIVPIAIITVVVVIGKVLMCGLGVFLAGRDGRTSLRVGMSLAQIGEFSFIIASLGISLKVTSDFLYPIIVAVSAITTLLTPYLIKMADPLSARLAKIIPAPITHIFNTYTTWLQSIHPQGDQALLIHALKTSFLQIFVNLILISAIFIYGSYFSHTIQYKLFAINNVNIQKALIWGTALIISLPFLIAIYRKLKAISMLIAELAVDVDKVDEYHIGMREMISEMIPMIAMLGIIFLLAILSASILPPTGLLILILVIAIILTMLFWRGFIRFHSRLQIEFMKRFKSTDKKEK